MKLHTVNILVIFWLGIFPLCTVRGSIASQITSRSSCIDLATQKLDIRSLASYERQHIPVKAVMFITKNGIKICVEPDLKWVQEAIRHLDRRPIFGRPTNKAKPKRKPKSKPKPKPTSKAN
ncbi:monocyte chemotactic protein 1B-like [Carettochelys insculpta]|uniref:monocyte chemotactic protein 1B-like n=1 Tax=Carettochelys insculpta TaxID=44489 RepID=UPI003EC08955